MLKFCSYGPNDAGFDVSGIRKCQIRRSWDFQNSKSAQIWDFQKTSKSGKKSRGYHTNFFKFESTKFGTPNEAKAHYNLPFLRPCWDPSRSSRRRPQNAGKIADCNGMKPQNWDFRKFAIFWRKFGIPVQQKNLLVVVGIFKKCLNFVATGQTTPDLTFPGSGNVKSGVVGIFKIQKVGFSKSAQIL